MSIHAYPLSVLIFGGMAACIGLEILGLYASPATHDDAKEYVSGDRSFPLLPKPFHLADVQNLVRKLWAGRKN